MYLGNHGGHIMFGEDAVGASISFAHHANVLLTAGVAGAADVVAISLLFGRARRSRQRSLRRLRGGLLAVLALSIATATAGIILRSDEASLLSFAAMTARDAGVFGLLLALLVSCALADRYVVPTALSRSRSALAGMNGGRVARLAVVLGLSVATASSLAAMSVAPAHVVPPLAVGAQYFVLIWLCAFFALVLALLMSRLTLRPEGDTTWPTSNVSLRPANDDHDDVPSFASGDYKPKRQARPARQTPPANPKSAIASAFQACRSAFAGTAAISLLTNMLMLAGPLYMLQIYDRVLTSRSTETLIALTVLIAGLYLFMAMLEIIRTRVLTRIALRFERILSEPLFAASIKVAPAGRAEPAGQALRDLEQVRHFLAGPGPVALFDLPWAPIYFAVVFLMHPVLGLLALAGAVVLVGLSIWNEAAARQPTQDSAAAMARSFGLVEAGRRNAEALQSMGMADRYRRRWLDSHHDGLAHSLKASDTSSSLAVAIRVTRMLLQSLVLAVGAYLALLDQVSPGVMIAASILTARALAPIEQIVAQWRGFLAMRQGLQRCRGTLDACADTQERMALPDPSGRVDILNLYVAPLGSREPIIKGLNFRLEPGAGMVVIGPSGSGKSSLARALVGVWPARQGEIRLDGAALDQWDGEQLGRHIGYVPQDVELFGGTVADNIARFEAEPDPHAVIAAARKAGVHEMILHLADGYGTAIGDGGAALSGGQRQRIALARALYGNPALLVMDEPNASLDAEGEAALVNAIIQARREGSTVIVMAHRRSLLKAVDHALVLRDGRQTAFGPVGSVLNIAPAKSQTGKVGKDGVRHITTAAG